MLPFFPTPVPGETVSSVICRFIARSPTGVRRTLDEVGFWRATAAHTVPSKISRLAELMPAGHPWSSPQKILVDHTIAPYHLFFSHASLRAQAMQRMVEPNAIPAIQLGIWGAVK